MRRFHLHVSQWETPQTLESISLAGWLGRELIARLEQDAAAAGIEERVLLTETAEPIFRTLGYAAIDRAAVHDPLKHSAEFHSLCPASAVCMRKVLQP